MTDHLKKAIPLIVEQPDFIALNLLATALIYHAHSCGVRNATLSGDGFSVTLKMTKKFSASAEALTPTSAGADAPASQPKEDSGHNPPRAA